VSGPYVDPGTGVLYNKPGLKTWAELLQAQREITTAREVELH
jgi:fido (protein-threonine AMPylation protein)